VQPGAALASEPNPARDRRAGAGAAAKTTAVAPRALKAGLERLHPQSELAGSEHDRIMPLLRTCSSQWRVMAL